VRAPPLPPPDENNVLRSLDLGQTVAPEDYTREREDLERRLNLAIRSKKFAKKSVVVVFEGADAAGKGGAIRRITGTLDARLCHVVPIAAPTEEEREQPYLWRFWRHMPRRKRIVIFDRSWYGRVLVERVEGFASQEDWMRAYSEITDFEAELVRHGTIVVKFWLQISKDEQLVRFKERENVAFKRFKITQEDWRNREKWDAYERAVCDMVDRTSVDGAKWTLVPANDKRFARIHVMRTLCERIEEATR
jgi:polyphosphate kinase 2 (PPK2 family)